MKLIWLVIETVTDGDGTSSVPVGAYDDEQAAKAACDIANFDAGEKYRPCFSYSVVFVPHNPEKIIV